MWDKEIPPEHQNISSVLRMTLLCRVRRVSLPVITWYAIFTIRPKCQQRTAIFAECEVSLSRFLLMHRLYCLSDYRPILCGNLIEFDGKKCLYSRSFRFYKHFDVSEKNMGCIAHQKNIFATFPLLANADNIHKYKIEWFSETETLLLLTLWQRPQEHFNRHPPLWHPYTYLTWYLTHLKQSKATFRV